MTWNAGSRNKCGQVNKCPGHIPTIVKWCRTGGWLLSNRNDPWRTHRLVVHGWSHEFIWSLFGSHQRHSHLVDNKLEKGIQGSKAMVLFLSKSIRG